MSKTDFDQYLKDHIPKFSSNDNNQLIDYLLVLGISTFKSITESRIVPSKSIKKLKKVTGKKSFIKVKRKNCERVWRA